MPVPPLLQSTTRARARARSASRSCTSRGRTVTDTSKPPSGGCPSTRCAPLACKHCIPRSSSPVLPQIRTAPPSPAPQARFHRPCLPSQRVPGGSWQAALARRGQRSESRRHHGRRTKRPAPTRVRARRPGRIRARPGRRTNQPHSLPTPFPPNTPQTQPHLLPLLYCRGRSSRS